LLSPFHYESQSERHRREEKLKTIIQSTVAYHYWLTILEINYFFFKNCTINRIFREGRGGLLRYLADLYLESSFNLPKKCQYYFYVNINNIRLNNKTILITHLLCNPNILEKNNPQINILKKQI
jgi:hypothetical protein